MVTEGPNLNSRYTETSIIPFVKIPANITVDMYLEQWPKYFPEKFTELSQFLSFPMQGVCWQCYTFT